MLLWNIKGRMRGALDQELRRFAETRGIARDVRSVPGSAPVLWDLDAARVQNQPYTHVVLFLTSQLPWEWYIKLGMLVAENGAHLVVNDPIERGPDEESEFTRFIGELRATLQP